MDVRPFTRRGMETINKSLDYVSHHKHPHVGIEHLLFALTTPDSDTAVSRYEELSAACKTIREIVTNAIKPGGSDGSHSVPQTPAAKQVIMNSMRIAESLDHAGVNPEHMFLALLDLSSEQLVNQIIDHDNIDVGHLREQLTTACLLYTSPSPRDRTRSRMPSSA